MSYFADGDKTVWDVGGVYLAASEQKGKWIDVLRRHRPPASVPDSVSDRWHNVETGAHPYTATAYATDGGTRIETVVNAKKIAAHESDIAYTVTLAGEGTQDAQAMKHRLDAIVAGASSREIKIHGRRSTVRSLRRAGPDSAGDARLVLKTPIEFLELGQHPDPTHHAQERHRPREAETPP